MSDLVSRMASVGAKSEVVNGSLSEKRLRIDKLVRVRRLLHVSRVPQRFACRSFFLCIISHVYIEIGIYIRLAREAQPMHRCWQLF